MNQLTDKDLADIGLCRGDINAVAKGSVDHLIKRGVNIDPDYFNLNQNIVLQDVDDMGAKI